MCRAPSGMLNFTPHHPLVDLYPAHLDSCHSRRR
jgi:hypothetical protein